MAFHKFIGFPTIAMFACFFFVLGCNVVLHHSPSNFHALSRYVKLTMNLKVVWLQFSYWHKVLMPSRYEWISWLEYQPPLPPRCRASHWTPKTLSFTSNYLMYDLPDISTLTMDALSVSHFDNLSNVFYFQKTPYLDSSWFSSFLSKWSIRLSAFTIS